MKKILMVFIALCILGCKTFSNQESVLKNATAHFEGVIGAGMVLELNDRFDWTEQEVLIVNYNQPKDICDIETFHSYRNSRNWWVKFYSEIDLESAKNVFVYSPTIGGVKENNSFYSLDKDHFLFKNFFNKKRSCFGVLVINKKGEYYQYNGHYDKYQVDTYIKNIRPK